MKRMPQEDKMTDNTKRSLGRKNPLLLLFLLLACLAALACLAGCGRSQQGAAGSVNEADLQSAQSRENFTISLASVTDGGECRSVEWKVAGDKYCLTEDGFSTYYQKTDGVYERCTEDDEDWTNTRKDDIGACLDGCFPLYGAFFGREAVFASFDADGDTLSARASLLEALSGAELEVVSLQVRLADGKFYTASAEARRGDEAVTVEYLFHSYGTTEVDLPGAKLEIGDYDDIFDGYYDDILGGNEEEPPHDEVIGAEDGAEGSITMPDNSEVAAPEGGFTLPDNNVGAAATAPDDTDITSGTVSPTDPGYNVPDDNYTVPDDGNGDSGDIEIVDPDDGIFDLFPEENEPATEPPGFPEGNEPDTEDPIDPDYGGLIVFDPTVRLP